MAKRLTPRSGVCSSAQGPYVDFTETPPDERWSCTTCYVPLRTVHMYIFHLLLR